MLLDGVQAIRLVAERLDSLGDRVVFLGGATLGLLVTEPAAAPPRPTKDVDLVVEITMSEYLDNSFRSQLLDRGFREVIDEGVICRWQIDSQNSPHDASSIDIVLRFAKRETIINPCRCGHRMLSSR